MSNALQAVRGMNDILPDEAEIWDRFEDVVKSLLRSYGYRPIRLPVVEPTPLFKRAIGEVTDIVEKEMYSFEDALNGEHLTLRPEGTAGCVRAAIQHSLVAQVPAKLYYMGQMFRHERPQKGRYRQFHQVGVEALGFSGPDVDGELILMCARLWDDLGLSGIQLQINSLGQAQERSAHRADLISYLERHASLLDEDARRRLHSNPLRILDSKNPAMQAMIADAPKLIDYLGEESLAHFEGVQKILRDAAVPYVINPRLVRGLDYYNLTVFEWVTDQLGAQGTVCAGGRYDGLIAQLGGKGAPAAGFAMGVERLVALLVDQGGAPEPASPDVYLVHQGESAQRAAFIAAESLRSGGLDVVMHLGGGSFKSQMKKADGSGAAYAVIIGDDEAAVGEVSLKHLRGDWDAKTPQRRVRMDMLLDTIMDELMDWEDA
jgi:histidyl-tRNA synthetase